jgi:hypothetical protein
MNNPPVSTPTLHALPTPMLLPSTLARRAAEYAMIEAQRTVENWDAVEEYLAALVMRIPTAQRRGFHRLVREARHG